MSLQQKINAYKQQFLATAPAEKVALMNKATEELSNSGILDRFLPAGGSAPEFSLQDSTGQPVRSVDLVKQGAVVITFYRGIW